METSVYNPDASKNLPPNGGSKEIISTEVSNTILLSGDSSASVCHADTTPQPKTNNNFMQLDIYNINKKRQKMSTSFNPQYFSTPKKFNEENVGTILHEIPLHEHCAATKVPNITQSHATGDLVHTQSDLSNSPEHVFCDNFKPRKGTKECLSKCQYENIGKGFIGKQFQTLMLQWNPNWFETQKQVGKFPPICKCYPSVQLFYENEIHFYTTYLTLNLMDSWTKLCNAHDHNAVYEAKFITEEIKFNFIEVECCIDRNVCPKVEDIVLCKIKKLNGNYDEIFGIVFAVSRHFREYTKNHRNDEYLTKRNFKFFCVQSVNSHERKTIEIQVLFNVRLSVYQTRALQSLYEDIKYIIINPLREKEKIDVIVGQGDQEVLCNAIIQSILCPLTQITLVDTCSHNTIEIITILVHDLLQHGCLIFICLTSTDLLQQLACLLNYDTIIAVSQKEMRFNKDLMKLTLEKCKKRESVADIYNRCPITLSLFSSPSLMECAPEFERRDVVGIFHNAELCTELDTAMPLSLNIDKLIMLGNTTNEVPVDPFLKTFGYSTSLFKRLHTAKQM